MQLVDDMRNANFVFISNQWSPSKPKIFVKGLVQTNLCVPDNCQCAVRRMKYARDMITPKNSYYRMQSLTEPNRKLYKDLKTNKQTNKINAACFLYAYSRVQTIAGKKINHRW